MVQGGWRKHARQARYGGRGGSGSSELLCRTVRAHRQDVVWRRVEHACKHKQGGRLIGVLATVAAEAAGPAAGGLRPVVRVTASQQASAACHALQQAQVLLTVCGDVILCNHGICFTEADAGAAGAGGQGHKCQCKEEPQRLPRCSQAPAAAQRGSPRHGEGSPCGSRAVVFEPWVRALLHCWGRTDAPEECGNAEEAAGSREWRGLGAGTLGSRPAAALGRAWVQPPVAAAPSASLGFRS